MKKYLVITVLASLLFTLALPLRAQVLDNPPRDGVYEKQQVLDKKPIPYVHLREADVVWSKRIWRVIDLREKINHPFYYPLIPHNGWKSFMTIVMDALREGSITAYDITETDEFLVPLTFEEIMARLERSDTVQLQRPFPPYDYYDTVITTKFNSQDVKRIRVKEDWYFDKQRSQMDVRILGICPVRDSYDENGNFRGFDPLFWIYFPEARQVFARNVIFNRFNDSERRTYDEIFWKRVFGSYVYKEQNVYDRRIADYATGMDALLEAERVKNDLFKFEHDLWEF
ncbi:MAG TPA: gliding motility protein GldN [Bacteroidales bacterium]|nr:gliding motility protein GldN [Bacteroidales bacterium]HRZ77462.1 gliding motility protein GldN [Bacteroidales bacterium]